MEQILNNLRLRRENSSHLEFTIAVNFPRFTDNIISGHIRKVEVLMKEMLST